MWRWVGEGAACRSSSSPPINTSLPRCTIGGWIQVSGVFALKKAALKLTCHRSDSRLSFGNSRTTRGFSFLYNFKSVTIEKV